MSDEKSDEAIIVVANDLFGRKHFGEWRKYTPNILGSGESIHPIKRSTLTTCQHTATEDV